MELSDAERAARDAADVRDRRLAAGRRRREGIVHTPPELARFVAHSADRLLRQELSLLHGLASHELAIVDPACGPGALLAAALAVGHGRGDAPCAVVGIDRDRQAIDAAHAALGPEFARASWPCTLVARDTLSALPPAEVARVAPVLCVLGNPPWVSSAQAPPEPWLDTLLQDFRRDAAGEPLGERKIGVLSDAYVRFLRWASEAARLASHGALMALITNGSYLDGPVHRGVRAALLRYFDTLHVLDLGGSALIARSGGRDGNVFGVRTSVAVLFAVRHAKRDESRPGTVRYLRLVGSADAKLAQLPSVQLDDPAWRTLALDARYQRFVPTRASSNDYSGWPSLAELMPFHREGVQTNRDDVVVDIDRARLLARLRAFACGHDSSELGALLRPLGHYDPEAARAALREALARDPEGLLGIVLRTIAYRPFDSRFFVPFAPVCHRPRRELLAAMDHSALALVTVRKDRGEVPWAHVTAATSIIDNCHLSTRSSCRARAFPTHDPEGRENLDAAHAALLGEAVGRALGSVEVAHYVLAVLASSAYAARHDAALRIDYPRIPPPRDAADFEAKCATGAELAALACAPLAMAMHAAPGEATYGRVALDEERGELTLGREVVATLTPAALALRIGQQRPVQGFLRSHASAPLDLTTLRALCERVCCIAEITQRVQ